jgi:hypothetical protein
MTASIIGTSTQESIDQSARLATSARPPPLTPRQDQPGSIDCFALARNG